MVTVAVAKAEVWPRLSVTVHPKVKMVPAAGADLSATSIADVSAVGAGLGPTGNFSCYRYRSSLRPPPRLPPAFRSRVLYLSSS